MWSFKWYVALFVFALGSACVQPAPEPRTAVPVRQPINTQIVQSSPSAPQSKPSPAQPRIASPRPALAQPQTTSSTPSPESASAPAPVLTLFGIVIEPKAVTLKPGQQQRFRARIIDSLGNEIQGLDILWGAIIGGSITPDGIFTATKRSGEYPEAVRVEVAQGGQRVVAVATVVVEPGPLESVSLATTSVELNIGDVHRFVVKATDEYDNDIHDLNLIWDVAPDIGVINLDGRLTTSTKAGTFTSAVRVVASQRNISRSATATVTISPDPLERIEMLPGAATLEINATQSFTAQAFDQYGNEISDFSPVWETVGGSIDTSTVFKAGTKSGTFAEAVVAEGSFRGSTRTVAAEVTILPGSLVSLALKPEQLELEPQQEVQLEVIAADTYGNPITALSTSWSSLAEAGQVDVDGGFAAGTKAGTYQGSVSVQGTYGGATREASVDLVIIPGPVATVEIRPSSTTMFTGDLISLNLEASDAFGNMVTPNSALWEADAGSIQGGPSNATFKAGRGPGALLLAVQVTDGRGTAQGDAEIQVNQGYCDTSRATVSWETQWWSMNQDGSTREFLGSSELDRLKFDWQWDAVFNGQKDYVRLMATAYIVVRRQGPVAFKIGGDDGYRLLLNGEQILSDWSAHSYTQRAALKVLEPGTYRIDVDYFERTGQARLTVEIDPDVLEWEEIEQCFGGYVQPSDSRFLLYRAEESLDQVADRFGVNSNQIISSSTSEGTALLVPGAPRLGRKIIVLQGIDSKASCGDFQPHIGAPNLADRIKSMTHAIQSRAWETTGDASFLDASDVVTFSYANTYEDCSTGKTYQAGDLPSPTGFYAVYEPSATCAGVQQAADRLKQLIDRIIQLEPGTQFDDVGHSMGGMVAVYMMATLSEDEKTRVHSIVTLDSPLLGEPKQAPGSSCAFNSQAWEDIGGLSPVVSVIASIGGPRTLGRLLAINSSPIGDVIPGTQWRLVDCSSGATLGYGILGSVLVEIIFPGYSLIGAILGGLKGAYGTGHTCVWLDGTVLASLADHINLLE